MTGHVVVASRGGRVAKSRLRSCLDGAQREELTEAMLWDILMALRPALATRCVWLVTPTASLARLGQDAGARVLSDPGSAGLNGAFSLAREEIAKTATGSPLLLLPGDLPCIQFAEVEKMLNYGGAGRIAIAPTRADGGTGALALPAACPLPHAFGSGSYARHAAIAAAHGFSPLTEDAPGMGLDIDRPADVEALRSRRVGGRTGALLEEWKMQA